MTWNYRVVQHDDGKETWYQIHECFYASKDDVVPHSWTADSIAPVGESMEDLRLALDRMIFALAKPILKIDGDKLIVTKRG